MRTWPCAQTRDTRTARSSLELSRRGRIFALSSHVETDNTAPALRRLQPDAVRDAAQRFMAASEALVVVAGDRDAILFSVGHL
ncbi:MAG: hypothetical protein JNK05_40350 [Myxococcales bacterium]|nr:hypothetical protein [Myxococcales bacterium]